MPIHVKEHYKCRECLREYATREEAEECEKSHFEVHVYTNECDNDEHMDQRY